MKRPIMKGQRWREHGTGRLWTVVDIDACDVDIDACDEEGGSLVVLESRGPGAVARTAVSDMAFRGGFDLDTLSPSELDAAAQAACAVVSTGPPWAETPLGRVVAAAAPAPRVSLRPAPGWWVTGQTEAVVDDGPAQRPLESGAGGAEAAAPRAPGWRVRGQTVPAYLDAWEAWHVGRAEREQAETGRCVRLARRHEHAAHDLWALLDRIDTLDDSCREDDATFRRLARTVLAKRHKILVSDGYALRLPSDAEIAAAALHDLHAHGGKREGERCGAQETVVHCRRCGRYGVVRCVNGATVIDWADPLVTQWRDTNITDDDINDPQFGCGHDKQGE